MELFSTIDQLEYAREFSQIIFLVPLSCILSMAYRKSWLNLHLMNFLFLRSLIPTLAIRHTFLLSVPIQFSFYSDSVA